MGELKQSWERSADPFSDPAATLLAFSPNTTSTPFERGWCSDFAPSLDPGGANISHRRWLVHSYWFFDHRKGPATQVKTLRTPQFSSVLVDFYLVWYWGTVSLSSPVCLGGNPCASHVGPGCSDLPAGAVTARLRGLRFVAILGRHFRDFIVTIASAHWR